jgi:OOP family OmpA-OmpF porin
MLKWSRHWAPGLIPLAALWAFALGATTTPVENDLTARSGIALREAVVAKTVLAASGRDITLNTEAFSEAGRREALAGVAAVPGVRLVNDETRLVQAATPFQWSAERDNVRVTLSGYAPLPAIKADLTETARAAVPSTEIADHMDLARGAPPDFNAAAKLLVAQIGLLKDGKVALSDQSVSLSGMAREVGGREAIAAALKTLPAGFKVTENAIKAPPYVFRANKDPVAATVTLTGSVPDEAARTTLVAAAQTKFFSEKVVDRLRPSAGAPSGFAAAAAAALGALSRLSTGTLEMSDRAIKLSGDALYDAALPQIRAGLAAELPQGWKADAELSVKPPASPVDATVCQQLLSDTLKKGAIRFDSGKAIISRDSAGLLDRLIETAMRCPNSNIEVAGHTDSGGSDAANQSLSEARAQAVVNYLSAAGVAPERLKSVGYGSSQPVAPNDSEEGRAQNRRIEFVVR